jgi:hypothetical protein
MGNAPGDEAREASSRSEEYLQRQAEDLGYLRRQAERQDQNARLNTMLNLLAPLTGGSNADAHTGGPFRTCRYRVAGETAFHTIPRVDLCPHTMDFGGVTGHLRRN